MQSEKITALDELRDVVQQGLVADIFKMERSYHILSVIGMNADQVNDRNRGNFGELFGALQNSLEVDAVLAVARLYDAPSKQYPTRCLRKALSLLEYRGAELPEIIERHNTKRSLAFLGDDSAVVSSVDLGRDAFVAHFVPAFREILDSERVSVSIKTLRDVRDKRVAHNESAEPFGPTWESLKSLLELAQNFVGVIGWAFLGTVYVNNGTYFLSEDAKRPSRALNRLVGRLGESSRGLRSLP